MEKCSLCGKEVDTIKIIYAKELVGPFLPRLYICRDCENKKQKIDKLKREVFENDYKDKEE